MTVSDPCLPESYRNITHLFERYTKLEGDCPYTDSRIENAWFYAGNDAIVTSPPDFCACGYRFPIWMKGMQLNSQSTSIFASPKDFTTNSELYLSFFFFFIITIILMTHTHKLYLYYMELQKYVLYIMYFDRIWKRYFQIKIQINKASK